MDFVHANHDASLFFWHNAFMLSIDRPSIVDYFSNDAFLRDQLLFSPQPWLSASPDWSAQEPLCGPLWQSCPELDPRRFEARSFCSREVDFDWRTFVEIFLDDYHIEYFHPGLRSLSDPFSLRWSFGDHWSLQRLSTPPGALSGSPIHRELSRLAREAFGAEIGDQGSSFWGIAYPGLIFEWTLGCLAVCEIRPLAPSRSIQRMLFLTPRGLSAEASIRLSLAHQRAYWETSDEDDEIGARIAQGRRALIARGESDFGPVHPHLELGIDHFHRWLSSAASRS